MYENSVDCLGFDFGVCSISVIICTATRATVLPTKQHMDWIYKEPF